MKQSALVHQTAILFSKKEANTNTNSCFLQKINKFQTADLTKQSTHCIVFRIKIVAFDTFLQEKLDIFCHIQDSIQCNPNILRMGQKFAIFILLWISLTFNLESNEMLSDFLVFYFFTDMTVYLAYS